MELARLIELLSRPAAYPYPVDEVTVCQTHISVVFLAGPFAYKIKKPVDFGFLDFSTLDKRRHFCDEEVRLNRRLAPEVYLGVVPVTESGMDGTGAALEWAVKMQRLPEEATLADRLQRGELSAELVEALARRLAAFHRSAERSPGIAALGRFDAVARNLRDIYAQSIPRIGTTVSRAVFDRLAALNEEHLARLRPLIDERAGNGVPCDCHGDLHLDHVYWFPERAPPADLVIVDCIEFTERFRCIDPVADLAFPVMDLIAAGRRDLARALAAAYFQASGDEQGQALLPLYTAYRATVRGSVEGLKLGEQEVPAAERAADLLHARAHWLVALGELEEPARRPLLLLVAGLPGTGKSTLARGLAAQAGYIVIRSDVVRKEGAGPGSEALYSPESTERTYAECLRRAEAKLFEGQRVLVDANFREEQRRQTFLALAQRWGVPSLMFVCRADPATVRQRLEARHGDASDADWAVYQQLEASWEEPGPLTWPLVRTIDTNGTPEEALRQALARGP